MTEQKAAHGSPIPRVDWSTFKRTVLVAAVLPLIARYGFHAEGMDLELIVVPSYLYCMAGVLLGHRHVEKLLRASASTAADARHPGN